MAINNTVNNFVQKVSRPVASAIFPNDFEYYALTLELVDSSGRTADSLVFPVMPSSMNYISRAAETVKKTAGGAVVNAHESFNPIQINISGTFGRKARLILGRENILDFFNKSSRQGFQRKVADYNPQIKTGFGVLKILESIVNKSRSLDDYNEPYKLFLYNPALGHSFLVRASNFTTNQEENATNMIWQYSIEFDGIAPLDAVGGGSLKGALIKHTALNALQTKGDRLANEFSRALR